MRDKNFTIGDLLELEKQGYCINFRDGMVESVFKPGKQDEDGHLIYSKKLKSNNSTRTVK